jgi:hypothetical protein
MFLFLSVHNCYIINVRSVKKDRVNLVSICKSSGPVERSIIIKEENGESEGPSGEGCP